VNETILRCDALWGCDPCGHCGRRPQLRRVRHLRAELYRLACPNEDCGNTTDWWPTRDAARAAWNEDHVEERP